MVGIDIELKASTSLSAVARWDVGPMIWEGTDVEVLDMEILMKRIRNNESQDCPS